MGYPIFAVPLLASLLAAPGGPSRPAVYFEQTTTVLHDGQAAGPGVVSRVWYAGQRMRMEAAPSGMALVLRLDEGRGFRIDPAARTVTAVDLESLRTRAHLDSAMAADLMGAGEAARTVRLRGTRTLAGHACRGYRITAGSTRMDVWMAEDVGVGVDTFTGFLEWSGASASLRPLLEALRELPGFPMQTRARVTILDDVQETLSTITAVRVGAPPAGTFDAPAGFTVTEAR